MRKAAASPQSKNVQGRRACPVCWQNGGGHKGRSGAAPILVCAGQCLEAARERPKLGKRRWKLLKSRRRGAARRGSTPTQGTASASPKKEKKKEEARRAWKGHWLQREEGKEGEEASSSPDPEREAPDTSSDLERKGSKHPWRWETMDQGGDL